MSPFLVYLWSISDPLKELAINLSWLFGILSFVGTIALFASVEQDNQVLINAHDLLKKYLFRGLYPLFFFCLLIQILLPSSDKLIHAISLLPKETLEISTK